MICFHGFYGNLLSFLLLFHSLFLFFSISLSLLLVLLMLVCEFECHPPTVSIMLYVAICCHLGLGQLILLAKLPHHYSLFFSLALSLISRFFLFSSSLFSIRIFISFMFTEDYIGIHSFLNLKNSKNVANAKWEKGGKYKIEILKFIRKNCWNVITCWWAAALTIFSLFYFQFTSITFALSRQQPANSH